MDGNTKKTMGNNLFQNFLAEEIKVQVKLSVCLIKHHAMKRYGGVERSILS
jgi:hypothetical protein